MSQREQRPGGVARPLEEGLVDPLGASERVRALVVGVGNLFLGDDGFGVEVARRLGATALPAGVRVADFGIRGVHLAFALLDPPDLLVVADASPRGHPPGTLYLLEPDLEQQAARARPDAHGMDLSAVFAQVRAMGGVLPRVLILGCEPATLDEHIGLSDPVQAAVEPALEKIRAVLERELTCPDRTAPKEIQTCS